MASITWPAIIMVVRKSLVGTALGFSKSIWCLGMEYLCFEIFLFIIFFRIGDWTYYFWKYFIGK